MPAPTVTSYNPDPSTPAQFRIDNEGIGQGEVLFDLANGTGDMVWRFKIPNGTVASDLTIELGFGTNTAAIKANIDGKFIQPFSFNGTAVVLSGTTGTAAFTDIEGAPVDGGVAKWLKITHGTVVYGAPLFELA